VEAASFFDGRLFETGYRSGRASFLRVQNQHTNSAIACAPKHSWRIIEYHIFEL
jgi:hypothetical protein